jgi:hypothetical protein
VRDSRPGGGEWCRGSESRPGKGISCMGACKVEFVEYGQVGDMAVRWRRRQNSEDSHPYLREGVLCPCAIHRPN